MAGMLKGIVAGLAMAAALAAGSDGAWAQRRGGTMVLAVTGEAPQIVGFMHSDTAGYQVAANIFSGLVGLNDDFQPVPDLAQRWEIAPDGRTYTFHLNPAAKFHDGKPVTAEDAAFTFSEVVCKLHPSRGSWCPNVEAFQATAPHTFVISLKQPYPPLMVLLAYTLRSGALILPKHIYAGSDPSKNPANDKPVGSGPFKFVSWERGSHVKLERNPDYFMAGKPYLDGLIVQVIADASARILAFERGEVDFIDYTGVPHNELKRIERDKRFEVIRGKDVVGLMGYWIPNLRHPQLGKREVRQAIYTALDLDDIADKALFGAGRTPKSPMSSVLRTFFTGEYATYKTNVARANEMLDAAGVARGADGTRFRMECAWAAGRPYNAKVCELMRDQLRGVGIDVQVRTYDRPTLIDRVWAKWTFDSAVELITSGPDPAISVTTRFATNQINRAPFTNAMGYSNPELDGLFQRDAVETDPAKRQAYWKESQAILMRDLPVIPVFEFPDSHLVNAKFKNVVTGPFGYFQSRHDAYMAQ